MGYALVRQLCPSRGARDRCSWTELLEFGADEQSQQHERARTLRRWHLHCASADTGGGRIAFGLVLSERTIAEIYKKLFLVEIARDARSNMMLVYLLRVPFAQFVAAITRSYACCAFDKTESRRIIGRDFDTPYQLATQPARRFGGIRLSVEIDVGIDLLPHTHQSMTGFH